MILYVENKKEITRMLKYLFILELKVSFHIPSQLFLPELSV